MIGRGEVLDHRGRQSSLSPGTSLFYSEMAGQEVIFELACPELFLVFFEKAELAKRMGIALSMLTLGILRGAAVPVMLHDPMKLRQDADRISGGLASLVMDGVMGEVVGPCHMQPLQDALDSNPCLIGSQHFCCSQGLLDQLFRLDKSICSCCDESWQGSR
jgi:hypothetical protein